MSAVGLPCLGGLKAVAVSDSINAIGLLLGGLLIPLFGLMAISDDGSILGGIAQLTAEHPDKFNAIGSNESSIPFHTIFTGMVLVQLFYWGTNQQIIQRALGAKNLIEGQKGLMLAAFFKILGPIIVVLPGIIAFHMFDGQLDRADQAYPKLVAEVLPPAFVGFFAAVLFGAILSSFNSALNSCVTLFGIDIYKEYMNEDANEATVVKKGKQFGIGLAVFAMGVAPFLYFASDGLFGYLQEVNGAYSIPILSVIIVGFLTKRVPAMAAKMGIIFAFVVYVCYIILSRGLELDWLPHMLDMQAITFVLTVILMLVIAKMKPRATDYVQQYTEEVDITTWKYVRPVGIAITLVVISTYVIFS